MTQLAIFELRLVAIDRPTTRRRWNGDPMVSKEASAALNVATDAFEATIKAAGLEVSRISYGVSAKRAHE